MFTSNCKSTSIWLKSAAISEYSASSDWNFESIPLFLIVYNHHWLNYYFLNNKIKINLMIWKGEYLAKISYCQ